jgi:hypothetical protein
LFGSLLGKTTKVLRAVILSGLILAMTFTANIGMIQSSAAASAGDLVTDFNGDDFEDLVVGVYREGIGTNNAVTEAGAINVIHGSEVGLSAIVDTGSGTGHADQSWTQNSPDVQSVAHTSERFGYSVAAGDFNSDGFSDIAVGVVQEHVGANCCFVVSGAVNIIYGTDSGLNPTADIPDQVLSQNSPNVDGISNNEEKFGFSLAIGDFNNDGFDDLAVGVPEEDITTSAGFQENAGGVNVLYGSSNGISATAAGDGTGRTDQFWSQNSFAIQDVSEQGDKFGSALATGDFNGDGYDDLGVGVPGEQINSASRAGALNIIYGSPTGLSATFVADQFEFQGSAGVENVPELDDAFGYALAGGDFDNDAYDDLAIGVPGESSGDTGAVSVIYGSSAGLSAFSKPDDLLQQGADNAELEGEADVGDRLGHAVVAGDFNDDGYDDLAIGVPGDNVPVGGTVPEAGAGSVNVVYGSPDGLSLTFVNDQIWNQNSPNIEEVASEVEMFGLSVTAGDYNGDGYDELAVGVPSEDVNNNTIDFAGAVHIIYGSSQGLSATGASGTGRADQIFTQNSPNIEGTAEVNDFFGSSLG